MKNVLIIQARMSSTRLPGKVFQDIDGAPMLEWVVHRSRKAKKVDEVVLATSNNQDDDRIEAWGRKNGISVCRGSLEDVLDRFYQCAIRRSADRVVRVTSDCPFIDPDLIDRTIGELDSGFDYVSNTKEPRTFPRGLDVEAMTFQALERAWRDDRNPSLREHVTPYIYRHPEVFQIGSVSNEEDLSRIRVTVDTVEDLRFVNRIAKAAGSMDISWKEVVRILNDHPEWMELNRDVVQKKVSP